MLVAFTNDRLIARGSRGGSVRTAVSLVESRLGDGQRGCRDVISRFERSRHLSDLLIRCSLGRQAVPRSSLVRFHFLVKRVHDFCCDRGTLSVLGGSVLVRGVSSGRLLLRLAKVCRMLSKFETAVGNCCSVGSRVVIPFRLTLASRRASRVGHKKCRT